VVLREYWKEDPRMELTVSTITVNNSTVTTQKMGLESIGHP